LHSSEFPPEIRNDLRWIGSRLLGHHGHSPYSLRAVPSISIPETTDTAFPAGEIRGQCRSGDREQQQDD
jgi:hypothetical protein